MNHLEEKRRLDIEFSDLVRVRNTVYKMGLT